MNSDAFRETVDHSVDALPTDSAMDQRAAKVQARKVQRDREQLMYRTSAIAASALFVGLAVAATYYRFFFHSQGMFPITEFWCTLFFIGGGMVMMEMYARWAHRVLWHEFVPGWAIHKSHHETRVGPFEANDIFAVMNAVPAIALTAYGFFTPSEWGGMCFGLGMGITVFGIAYMFVHDGLVHKRFPVGPIAEVPQLKRIAIAHRMHHSDKYGGLPYGMFLGPQELEAAGAGAELDRLVEEMGRTAAKAAEHKKTGTVTR
eukprot:jgi/Ulvmu1/4643/UM002_0374.1